MSNGTLLLHDVASITLPDLKTPGRTESGYEYHSIRLNLSDGSMLKITAFMEHKNENNNDNKE